MRTVRKDQEFTKRARIHVNHAPVGPGGDAHEDAAHGEEFVRHRSVTGLGENHHFVAGFDQEGPGQAFANDDAHGI